MFKNLDTIYWVIHFHVDHDALKYLINKFQLSGHIVQWVILLQEFMFKVLVQPRKNHIKCKSFE